MIIIFKYETVPSRIHKLHTRINTLLFFFISGIERYERMTVGSKILFIAKSSIISKVNSYDTSYIKKWKCVFVLKKLQHNWQSDKSYLVILGTRHYRSLPHLIGKRNYLFQGDDKHGHTDGESGKD